MKYTLFLFAFLFSIATFLPAQEEAISNEAAPSTITVVGQQATGIGRPESKLSSQPFLIPQGKIGIITDVTLEGSGFWIGYVGKKPLAIFKNAKQAIGYQLMPGQYYIYPSINFNNQGQPKSTATVTATITIQ